MLFLLLVGCGSFTLCAQDKIYEERAVYEAFITDNIPLAKRLLDEKYVDEGAKEKILQYVYDRGLEERNAEIVLYCLSEGVFPFSSPTKRNLYEMLGNNVPGIAWYLDYYEKVEDLQRELNIDTRGCRLLNKELIKSALENDSYDVKTLKESFFTYLDVGFHKRLREFLRLGKKSICSLLIERQAGVNGLEQDQTALMCAAEYGDKDLCTLLLFRGADPETVDSEDRTALAWAAMKGQEEVCKLLLHQEDIRPARGVNHSDERPDKRGVALIWAAAEGRKDVCELLLYKVLGGVNWGITDKHGRTAFTAAAAGGHRDLCKLLYTSGKAVLGYFHKDPRDEALRWAAARGDTKACKLLLQMDTDPRGADGRQHYPSRTPLRMAASGGHIDVCDLLLQQEADAPGVASAYETSVSLILAAANGHTGVCELLLRKGAQLETTDRKGHTALIAAAAGRHKDTCRLLLQRGAKLGTRANTKTALMYAAERGYGDICRLLCAECRESHGPGYVDPMNTALRWAAAARNHEAYELLLQMGADPKAASWPSDDVYD